MVPCYRLGKLHETIKDDLPHTTVGLYAAWKEIVGILKRQQEEPDYEYVPELPVRPAMA